MAGRAPVLASRRLWFALDRLSKNTLIDILVDRARAEDGEEAKDADVARRIQRWLRPVCRLRGDREPKLLDAMARLDKASEEYRKLHPDA